MHSGPSSPARTTAPLAEGFSLIEILIVVALIAMLTVLGSQLMTNLAQPTALTTAEAVAGHLDFARIKAASLGTYTRVAFGQTTKGGREALAVGLFFSKTGQASPNAADWQQLMPAQTFSGMTVAPCAASSGASFHTGQPGPDLTTRIAGQNVSFSGGLVINPSGAPRIPDTGDFSRTMCVMISNKVKTTERPAEILVAAAGGPPEVIPAGN